MIVLLHYYMCAADTPLVIAIRNIRIQFSFVSFNVVNFGSYIFFFNRLNLNFTSWMTFFWNGDKEKCQIFMLFHFMNMLTRPSISLSNILHATISFGSRYNINQIRWCSFKIIIIYNGELSNIYRWCNGCFSTLMCATDTPLGISLRNIRIHSAPFERIKWFSRVKSWNFGHQVNSDTHLLTVEIQMRRLIMSRLIRIFTVCLVDYFFLFQ